VNFALAILFWRQCRMAGLGAVTDAPSLCRLVPGNPSLAPMKLNAKSTKESELG